MTSITTTNASSSRIQPSLESSALRPSPAANKPEEVLDPEISGLHLVQLDNWQEQDVSTFGETKTVKVTGDHPVDIDNIDVKTFRLGDNGPSMQIASLGATPLQVTTADGKKIFWNSLDDGKGGLKTEINWDLKGAGFLGGAPIVAPASRTADENGKPIIKYGDRVIDLSDLVGHNNRIPKDKQDETGLAMHGAIFTSPEWKCTKIETKGNEALRLVYELNFADDYALIPFGKDAKATVVYTLSKDEKGNPVFETVLQFTNPEGAKEDLLLGSVAQHCFFNPGKDHTKTILETENLSLQYKGSEVNPALPTGELPRIASDSPYNFDVETANEAQPLQVYSRTDRDTKAALDAVLTNDSFEQNLPSATIHQGGESGLKIKVDNNEGFNGMVICTKTPKGLMVEPIAQRPNNFNTPGICEKDQAIVLKPGEARKFTSTISLVA